MNISDYDILSLFKGSPNTEISTTEIVSLVYPDEYTTIITDIEDIYVSSEKKKSAKKNLAKLQRRILHHLSSLVKNKLIHVSRTEGRGKKYFALNIKEGEELVIDKYKRKIIVSKPSAPILPLSDLETDRMVYRVEADSFFERINAVLLEGDKFANLDDAYDLIYSLFPNVNDVIGINNFEKIIEIHKIENILLFLNSIEEENKAYNKRTCCIIDFTNIHTDEKIKEFLDKYLSEKKETITFVFDTTSRELLHKPEVFQIIFEQYAKNKQKLNIKNDDIHPSPYIIGKAGPYCFNVEDWRIYSKKWKKRSVGLVCTQSSIIIDLEKMYSKQPSARELEQTIVKIAKALFVANTYQRKNSEEYYKKFHNYTYDGEYQIFNFSRNMIRFWNFEVFDNIEEDITFLETLNEINRQIKELSRNQETVYLSCGMPTPFKIAFSIAYRQFDQDTKLDEKFEKVTIASQKEIYEPETKRRVGLYEVAGKVFDGGSELRFLRSGNSEPLDLIREVNTVMNSFTIPFFCYNFAQQLGINRKLFDFVDHGNN
jgi:hypothetical protein